ncbi:viral A-type inclusion protein repeat-containing domain protein [Dictyocaulus viviparus]|uniref:Viral A-type inclusion protein repeat-containing domain protein n=1 Tax=Dictyocaulus viviparus TaxID=29172 RepID=A0A0D8Y0H3_DICVI|nr:viral A-type inclusion protein repeat-containing domain protein [Dictyocaulus viviparus]
MLPIAKLLDIESSSPACLSNSSSAVHVRTPQHLHALRTLFCVLLYLNFIIELYSTMSVMNVDIETLRKDLRERVSEVDALKKKLQKAEKERQQWETQKRQLESKLPVDVQLLMAQKRELTMQLDREQNEKHELFLQINSMIAQLAEIRPPDEIEKLQSRNIELQRRVEELEISSAKESSRFETELQRTRHESEVEKHQMDREKRKMQEEIEEMKKALHMKAAALQSLMMATQDSARVDHLMREKNSLEKSLVESEAALVVSKRELQIKNEEIAKLQRLVLLISEENVSLSKKVDEFKKKLNDVEKNLQSEIEKKESLMKSCEKLLTDGKEAEEKLREWRSQHEEDENVISELRGEVEKLKNAASQKQNTIIDEHEQKLQRAVELESAYELKLMALQSHLDASQNELASTKEKLNDLERELSDLRSEKKKLESKASVADEFSTLMTSLSVLRAENSQFQEEIRALHTEMYELKRELERSVELCEEWKGRTESAEKEIEIMERQINTDRENIIALSSLSEHHTTLHLPCGNGNEASTDNSSLEEETRVLRAEIDEIKNKQKVCEEESMRKLHELTERCEALQKEANTSRSRYEELEALICWHTLLLEKHNRYCESTAKEKKELLEISEEQCERLGILQEEVEEYKKKLDAAEHLTFEKEYNEMKYSLQNLQEFVRDSLGDIQDSEDLAVRIKKKFDDLEREHVNKLDELAVSHKVDQQRLEKRIEDMEAVRLEQVKELERQKHETAKLYQEKLNLAEKKLAETEESHRLECERLESSLKDMFSPRIEELKKAKSELEEDAKKQMEKLMGKIADLESRLNQASKNNTEMVANMRNMSALLETEVKKREDLTQERKKWQEQINVMEQQLQESHNSSDEVTKLAAENVRLAAELLKCQSQAEKTLEVEKETITKQFIDELQIANAEREKLSAEVVDLQSKMKVMQSRIEDQRSSLDQAEKIRSDEIASIQAELNALRKEKAKLLEEVEKILFIGMKIVLLSFCRAFSFRINNNGHPLPAARRTISNMSNYTYNTQSDFSEIEDVQKLRSEIDKLNFSRSNISYRFNTSTDSKFVICVFATERKCTYYQERLTLLPNMD